MCNKYFFTSSRAKERTEGYIFISTSKDEAYARKLAKSRFKSYGYKGRVIRIYPYSAVKLGVI
uniref:Uncharacterized protein n=1 Tax=Geladintestivirus 4 TaxID=3233136 RepID=A0AAU8MHP5_9CAUD